MSRGEYSQAHSVWQAVMRAGMASSSAERPMPKTMLRFSDMSS
jgi:hypothetical protein